MFTYKLTVRFERKRDASLFAFMVDGLVGQKTAVFFKTAAREWTTQALVPDVRLPAVEEILGGRPYGVKTFLSA